MSLHYGNKNIAEVYYGSKKIKEIYKGSKLVFGGELLTDSYIIKTDNTRINFSLDNTPISNLSTSGNATSSITVNGQSVVKNTIKEIYFGDSYNDITSIGASFLRYYSSLTEVDLSSLSNVTSIGNYFLYYCSGLTEVDLSPLSNVTNIGGYFLYRCSSLTSLDLSSLSNITSIGNYFLAYCSGLTSVDLSPLSNITRIGNMFLMNCTSLTSVDLSGLSNLTSIGANFLYSCTSLASIDLSPLSNITSIGASFLINCSNLTEVDLSPLSNLTIIEDYFLYNCSSLTSVDLSPLSNLTSIGEGFLQGCSSLATLIMGAETPPTLGSSAFRYSNNLSLILVPCGSESAYKSATNWIAKASIIEENCRPSYMILTDDTRIDFDLDNTPIESFYADFDTEGYDEELDEYYLIYYINNDEVRSYEIKEVYFGDSYNEDEVISIGSYFLNTCINLTSIDLSGLSNVTSIGDYFLAECYNLTSLNLSPLSNVTSIGYAVIQNCLSLTTLIMGAETPPTLGGNAFVNTRNLSLIQVPCGSESTYKLVTNWIAKASIIQGDC